MQPEAGCGGGHLSRFADFLARPFCALVSKIELAIVNA